MLTGLTTELWIFIEIWTEKFREFFINFNEIEETSDRMLVVLKILFCMFAWKSNIIWGTPFLSCKLFLTQHVWILTLWTGFENELIWKSSQRLSSIASSFKWIIFYTGPTKQSDCNVFYSRISNNTRLWLLADGAY